MPGYGNIDIENYNYNKTYSQIKNSVEYLKSLNEELRLIENPPSNTYWFNDSFPPIKNKLLFVWIYQLKDLDKSSFPINARNEFKLLYNRVTSKGDIKETISSFDLREAVRLAVDLKDFSNLLKNMI